MRLGFALPSLNALFLHGQRSGHPMQLHVEATGITHRFSISIASPQCGGAGSAVSAAKASSARCSLQSFLWFDEWPVDAVHLVVKAAGVAQVVPGSVPAPQWR